ncbi:unnamed protein product [Phytophthora fragariaefolia]|uniref:Serine/threonine-protein phosphatase PGAM5, mitochondrial n=1 Tax=Phytophthora fragariaefolia TaxID=1490495 RepID=A0A9W7CTK1_9STRA|nr:unnamed protein product [Phytophthora fragariaefolia]
MGSLHKKIAQKTKVLEEWKTRVDEKRKEVAKSAATQELIDGELLSIQKTLDQELHFLDHFQQQRAVQEMQAEELRSFCTSLESEMHQRRDTMATLRSTIAVTQTAMKNRIDEIREKFLDAFVIDDAGILIELLNKERQYKAKLKKLKARTAEGKPCSTATTTSKPRSGDMATREKSQNHPSAMGHDVEQDNLKEFDPADDAENQDFEDRSSEGTFGKPLLQQRKVKAAVKQAPKSARRALAPGLNLADKSPQTDNELTEVPAHASSTETTKATKTVMPSSLKSGTNGTRGARRSRLKRRTPAQKAGTAHVAIHHPSGPMRNDNQELADIVDNTRTSVSAESDPDEGGAHNLGLLNSPVGCDEEPVVSRSDCSSLTIRSSEALADVVTASQDASKKPCLEKAVPAKRGTPCTAPTPPASREEDDRRDGGGVPSAAARGRGAALARAQLAPVERRPLPAQPVRRDERHAGVGRLAGPAAVHDGVRDASVSDAPVSGRGPEQQLLRGQNPRRARAGVLQRRAHGGGADQEGRVRAADLEECKYCCVEQRIFVLRGQELSYYTIDSKQRYGALKGTWDIAGASVERLDNLSFNLKLANGSVRSIGAPCVQTLMDWMTAIAVAAEAHIVEPTTDLSLVDQSRTTHIILVRHGHYASSQTPSVDMHGPLTDLGVLQARKTGRFLHNYLSERMVLKRFPKFPIYHSGVRRAVETAGHIGDAFPSGCVQLRENKLFREAWPGNPLPNGNRQQLAREKLDNMVSDCARLKMAYRTTFRHLIPQDLELEEHELSEEDKKLYASTFGIRSTQTRAKDRFRILVCHANIIRWFVCKSLGVDPDGTWGRMRYNHCGITAMEVDSVGNVQLTYMNQTGHLETTQLSEV